MKKKLSYKIFSLAHWASSTPTSQRILVKIVHLVANRDIRLQKQGKPQQGMTDLLLTKELMQDLGAEVRMGMEEIQRLLDPGLPALRRISYEEAIALGMLTPKEAGPPRPAYMYEPLLENWLKLAKRNREKWEAERAARNASVAGKVLKASKGAS